MRYPESSKMTTRAEVPTDVPLTGGRPGPSPWARIRRLWGQSLRFRLLTLGLMPLLIAFPIIVGVLVVVGGQRADALLVANLRSNLGGAGNYLEQVKADIGIRVSQMVRAERLTKLVIAQPESAELRELLNTAARGGGLDFLIVATQEGRVLASSSGVPAGAHLPESYVVRQAAIGVANAAFERIPPASFDAFSPRFKEVIGNSGDAVLINAAAHFPLGVNSLDAILVGGILLNKNTALIEHMREIIFPVGVLPGDAEGLSGIFVDEQSLVISRQRQPGLRGESLQIDRAIMRQASDSSEAWFGRVDLAGISHHMGFAPLLDGLGQPIAQLGVAIPDGPYDRENWLLLLTIAGLMALTMLGLSLLFLRAGRSMTQRLGAISSTMNAVHAGQPDARVPASGLHDEVARLGDDFNDLLETIAHQNEMRRAVLQTVADEASRRRTLFEHERDGVVILNTDGSVFEANPKAAWMLGYTVQEMVGRHLAEWDAALGDDARGSLLSRVGSAGLFCESTHRRKDGTAYCAEVSLSRADWGEKTFVLLVQRDISDRKAVEAELERYRSTLEEQVEQRTKELNDRSQQLNAIFTLSPDGFLSFDQERRVSFANTAFLRMTGLLAEDVIGMDETALSTLLASRSLPTAPFPGIVRLRNSQRRQGGQADGGTAIGKRRQLFELQGPGNRVLEVSIRMADSPNVSQILYFRDVTHETEVDRMKSEFLSTAAHELRTPMSSIYGFAQLLMLKDFDREHSRDMLGTIVRQAELMIAIINELLDLARIEARRGKDFVIARVGLGDIVQEVVAGYNIPLDRQPPCILGLDQDLQVDVDQRKIQQALLNILSNAYKYSPAGGPVGLTLLNESASEPSRVGVQLTDHGLGMTPDQLARVFERFYRADASGNIPGTGLGMCVVKEIVELHGGEVEVASTQGVGTTVTVWIPAAGKKPLVAQEIVAESEAERLDTW